MNKKKIWMIGVSVVLAIAIVVGALMIFRKPDSIAVYPWSTVGYTDYYMNGSQSSGLVATDKVQTLFVSETQKVTQILVQEGQQVKEGDVLITYDTTLSDLALERKDLDIQQKEVTLENARAELDQLYAMVPMVVTPPPETKPNPDKVDHTKSPVDINKLGTYYDGDGRTAKTPFYFWLRQDGQIDEDMISYLIAEAGNPDVMYVVFQIAPEDKPNMPYQFESAIKFSKIVTPVYPEPTEPQPTEPVPTESTAPTEETTPTESTAPTEETTPTESTAPTEETTPTEDTTPTSEPDTAAFAAVKPEMKTTYAMSFFVPGVDEEIEQGPQVDWNSGYTEEELKSLRIEKAAQIKQLEQDVKMGKAELNIMKKEAADGKVCAKFDGVITSVLEPESAVSMNMPVVKLSGGGGFYVEGSVGELDLDTIQVGQKVMVNSWDNGQTYEGQVVEIGQYPSEDQGYHYSGAVNQTYYPYRVFIDESADLMEGAYVDLTYKAELSQDGIMKVQNAFIRQEGNQSFVYVRNENGKLEKRQVQAGVSDDGFYTPIYSGVTEMDLFAFPYGKDLREGAPTFEGSDQDLYSG